MKKTRKRNDYNWIDDVKVILASLKRKRNYTCKDYVKAIFVALGWVVFMGITVFVIFKAIVLAVTGHW